MELRIDHIGIVVSDLESARASLGTTLGLTVSREVAVPGRSDHAVFYRCGDVDIELIEVLEPTERARRLDGAAARIEHIAFQVPDLDAAIAQLGQAGVETTAPVTLAGRLNTWTVPASSGGVMYQLVQGPDE